jgi:hypothetical protein
VSPRGTLTLLLDSARRVHAVAYLGLPPLPPAALCPLVGASAEYLAGLPQVAAALQQQGHLSAGAGAAGHAKSGASVSGGRAPAAASSRGCLIEALAQDPTVQLILHDAFSVLRHSLLANGTAGILQQLMPAGGGGSQGGASVTTRVLAEAQGALAALLAGAAGPELPAFGGCVPRGAVDLQRPGEEEEDEGGAGRAAARALAASDNVLSLLAGLVVH